MVLACSLVGPDRVWWVKLRLLGDGLTGMRPAKLLTLMTRPLVFLRRGMQACRKKGQCDGEIMLNSDGNRNGTMYWYEVEGEAPRPGR